MRYSAALGFAALMAVMSVLIGPANAQSGAAAGQAAPIGKVQSLTGTVKITHSAAVVVQASAPVGDVAAPKVGDPVYQGDLVETGSDSKLGISFIDGTAFNLSSNARMTLDQYVYDPKGTSNSTLFNLSKGAFTFIAGKVARTGDMKINTPVATMGIRGTAPHVEVGEDGTVKFSTLVEENKNTGSPAPPHAAPQPVRHAQSERPNASELAEKTFDKRLDICKGC